MASVRPRRLLERLPLLEQRPIIGYGCTAALSALALALRWGLDGTFPPGYPFLTFFPAVILSAFLFGLGPGIFAAVLCGLAAWYVFIPPDGFDIGRGTAMAMGFYTGVVSIDIALVHWMQQANCRLREERERSAMLAERSNLLFRELQHRVSNNLQVVAALLSLQKRGVADAAARAAMDDASRRLALIGRLHRQMHDPDGARIGLAAFLRDLAADAMEAAGRPEITLAVAAEDGIDLDADAAIPLALITAETIANAVEHGFADRPGGHIDLALSTDRDGVTLRVRDDGRGLPPGFDPAAATSLGLRLATMLARQIGGRFALERAEGGGTLARLHLPLRAPTRPAAHAGVG